MAKLENQKLGEIPLTVEELAALALNEQGFLLQHKLEEILESRAGEGTSHNWYVDATEVPVSLPNGDETRIDLVLRQGVTPGKFWRLVIECKRSSRDYKRWIFFGRTTRGKGPSPQCLYLEKADLAGTWNGTGDPKMCHRVEQAQAPKSIFIFDFGVEAKLERPAAGKRASATDAIEDAFQQVCLGQAGFALRLLKVHELNFNIIPVVVTTAELFSARFPANKISLENGMVESKDLKLTSQNWLAVNYRINDTVCQYSGVGGARLNDLAADLNARQVRTIFVVTAAHIHQFLSWLENEVTGSW